MSFLSHQRLHWGVHHEIMENLRLNIEQLMPDNTRPEIANPSPDLANHQDRLSRNQSDDDRFGP